MPEIATSLTALALAGCSAESDETHSVNSEAANAAFEALLQQSREALEKTRSIELGALAWLRVALFLDNGIGLGAGNDPRLLKLRAIAARSLGDEKGARRFESLAWELHPGILPQR